MDKRVLLIIPAYNEEKCILKTYKSIIAHNKKKGTKYDAIVINDGSTDNTKEVLTENKIPHINLVTNLGIGGAVQTGYKYAFQNNYDIAVQFDGDGQHDINYVENIIKPIIDNKCEMTIGSRFIKKNASTFKSSKMRRIGIKMISNIIHLKTKEKIYDCTSGFRAINKELIEFFSNYYPLEYPEPISITVILKKGFKAEEVPVSMNERLAGKSSINSWKSVYYMINVILTILLVRNGEKK